MILCQFQGSESYGTTNEDNESDTSFLPFATPVKDDSFSDTENTINSSVKKQLF